MPDDLKETPAEIEATTQARVQGFINGLILGLKANLQNLAIIGLSVLAGCNYVKNHSNEAKVQDVAIHAATVSDVKELQVATFGVSSTNSVAKEISTETNQITK